MFFNKDYREYTAWDNSDRADFYDKYGEKVSTHVDRYDWSGNYKGTDVYDSSDKKVGSYYKD